MIKIIPLSTIALLALLASGLQSALAGFDFSGGKTIKGNLKTVKTDYEFRMVKGQSYAIDLRSDKIDPYLKLFDSKGNQLGEDDDGGVGLDSKIFFNPPSTGMYKVEVSSYGGTEKGPFELHMRPALFGELTKKRKEVKHKIKLQIGRTYIIDMESGEFDSFMRIEDERGNVLKSDDDGGDFVHARIEFRPNMTADFYVVASSFEKRGSGRYAISIREQTK